MQCTNSSQVETSVRHEKETHSTAQHSTTLCNTTPCNTKPHSTTPYNTTPATVHQFLSLSFSPAQTFNDPPPMHPSTSKAQNNFDALQAPSRFIRNLVFFFHETLLNIISPHSFNISFYCIVVHCIAFCYKVLPLTLLHFHFSKLPLSLHDYLNKFIKLCSFNFFNILN